MYITINSVSHFRDQFYSCGRGDQFSYEALEALYYYYDELDDYELDVIEICCTWTEYDSEEGACAAHNIDDIDGLLDYTSVISVGEGCLVMNY